MRIFSATSGLAEGMAQSWAMPNVLNVQNGVKQLIWTRVEELRKAEIVIDVQKKVGALLGWPLPMADLEEKP